MTKEEIFEKVKKILVKNIQDYRKEVDDDITLDSSIDYDLGADSLDTFYITEDIESQFHISHFVDDNYFYHPGITVDEICTKIQQELNHK